MPHVPASGDSAVVRSPEVAAALANGRPVVALESTLLAHGLPAPRNREVADEAEAAVRAHGAVPATVAVLDGVPRVGLDADTLDRVCEGGLAKLSERGVTGKDVTPVLLEHLHAASDGASLTANVALVLANAELAARVAVALSGP